VLTSPQEELSGHTPSERCGALLPALLLTAVSGAAGMAHQLLWTRRMVDILGANAGTFTRVVAAFFLGLAAGAYFAARRRTPHPWRSVAVAEVLTALLALMLIGAVPALASLPPSAAASRHLQWLLPLLLVMPPAFAMGTVVPWMIRAIGAQCSVALYAVNTLGGIAGLALVLAWALPAFGLTGASLIALGLNFLAAAAAFLLGKWNPQIPRISADERRTENPDAGHLRQSAKSADHLPLFALAFASGFLVLGAEVLHQHQLAQLLVSSHISSGLVLTLVLGALGLGALLATPFARIGRPALTVALALAAVACAAQPLALVVQRGGLYYIPFQQPLASYAWSAFKVGIPGCAALLLPAAIVFPLLLRRAAEQRVDAGRLLAINGLGGWCGAEFAERFLAPTFGLWWAMALIAGGYAACVLLERGRTRWWLAPALAAVVAWSWKIDARLPFAGLSKGDTLVRVAFGHEGVVGVVRGEPDDWRILFNNNYTLGGSRAQFNQERQTLLPMLLHGDARRIATLGIATGSSLAGATLDPALESAEGIELSPLVLHFAAKYFAPFNRRVLEDPRVRVTLGDARIVITQRPAAFDVIEGDLFLPWRTGESRLFAREHFQNVRAALRPGGLFCQWLPMYQLTRAQFDTIARTFREVFPEAWILRGDFYEDMTIIALIGGRSLAAVDWEKVRAACDRTRAANLTHDPLLRHAEGVAMCIVGPLPAPPPGPVNTLANSWLEWDAARNLIGLREPWFHHIPLATYLRDIHHSTTPSLPESLRPAHTAGQLAHTLEITSAAHLPQAADAAAQLSRQLPSPLREDPDADWTRWPMRHRPVFLNQIGNQPR
jgi:spermidine synthase